MDFLKEFSKQFSSVARSVTEKSKDGTGANRLNAELKAAEEGLERLYNRYGKACYAVHEGRGSADAAQELALRIRAAELQVEELTAARDAARELKRCQGCGAVFPKEARYCSACGKKLPEEAPKPEPVELGEYCPNCGAKREGGEPVCPVCGADYEAPAPIRPRPDEPPVIGPDVEEPEDEIE